MPTPSDGPPRVASPTPETPHCVEFRSQLKRIRDQAQERFAHGATALQIAGGYSQGVDELILALWRQALQNITAENRTQLCERSAVIALGGFGRGEMAPFSDVDLLFLYEPDVESAFSQTVSQTIRDGWDTGLKFGHSVRTVPDALAAARQDIHFATALTDVRLLWGAQPMLDGFLRRYRQTVFHGRAAAFQAACVAARKQERLEAGGPVLQLEPDIKRSFGGLRDIHLIRWLSCAHYGVSDFDSLRLRGILSKDDVRRLSQAYDYLWGFRIRLHLSAGKEGDVLTRDQQLRMAGEQSIPGAAGQLPVERLMQEYFRHSLAVAELTDRFVSLHQRPTWLERAANFLITVRIDRIYRIGAGVIDVPRRFRTRVCGSLEGMLKLYLTAARYQALPSDRVQEWIKQRAPGRAVDLSPAAVRAFLQFLATPGKLGPLLRSCYQVGLLEVILPAFRHVRCLLQFNQYHSYTVDEHTLRSIEIVEGFAADPGPIGRAYRDIRHKEILHLALLLHDAGKGFVVDHSEVGRGLALDAATRLNLPESQRELLMFLVHRHLLMAELAFRRDASDPQVLLSFSHAVGSPETLKLLFVLTAADISAVGPGVWTSWKAELLTALYERTMQWLSGESQPLEEAARCAAVRQAVAEQLAAAPDQTVLLRRFDAFPSHYILSASPTRIAADLRIIHQRQSGEVHVEGCYEADTKTVTYRVLTHEDTVSGCFHKLTGILTAQRMDILSASICTSREGVIIDSYQVLDHDHAGEVPGFRIEQVSDAIRHHLIGNTSVESLVKRGQTFGPRKFRPPVTQFPLRVVIDNDWSERFTILEVFAHDRPGLLSLISKTIFELELSVVRAQISTHLDQVVDVFYITDRQGRKIVTEQQTQRIQDRLTREISGFEAAG